MSGLELRSLNHIFCSGRTTGNELHGIKFFHLHLLNLYAHVGHSVKTNVATKKEMRFDMSPAHENGALAVLAPRNARRRRFTTMETQTAAPHAVVDCRLAHSNREAQAPTPNRQHQCKDNKLLAFDAGFNFVDEHCGLRPLVCI